MKTVSARVATSAIPPRYANADECSKRYGLSKRHWLRLVDAGKAPQPTRFGKSVRWSYAALDDWDAQGNPAIRHVAKGGS